MSPFEAGHPLVIDINRRNRVSLGTPYVHQPAEREHVFWSFWRLYVRSLPISLVVVP